MMSALRHRPDVGGYPVWSPTDRELDVTFVGRGAARPRREILAAATGIDRPVAGLRQVHGSDGLEARAGCVGEADALTTARRDLALVISTADCVPIVLLGSDRVAAIHAGWRGIVAGVVPRAVETFAGSSDAPAAWIGPAIGACCYEVGDEVAERVLAARGDPEVRQRSRDASGSPRPRPRGRGPTPTLCGGKSSDRPCLHPL